MQEISLNPLMRDRTPMAAPGFHGAAADAPDLRDYWVIIRKRQRLIAGFLVAALGLTALVVFNLTPLYVARGTLLLEAETAPILDTKTPVNAPEVSGEHDFYKTQYDILQSRSLAAKVITELDLADNPLFGGRPRDPGLIAGWWAAAHAWIGQWFTSSNKAGDQPGQSGVPSSAIDAYLARLRIEPEYGTQLVKVAFSTPDPELSARIVDTHIDDYIRRGMELKADTARNAEQFLQNKLAELKDRVEKTEAALNAYRRDHGVIAFSLDETGKGQMLEQRLTDLNDSLAKVETDRITLEAQHDLIQQGAADALPAVMQNSLIQSLKQQVAQLAAQYAAMSDQFNPGYYRPLDDLKAKLDQSRTQLAQEIDRAAKSVESDYGAASARESMLEQEIANVKSQALALNDASLQDAVLVREVDASRNLYKSVLERVRELDVSADAPSSNVSVVDRAEVPRAPSSPRKLLSLALSGFLGLAGGVGLAFFLEFFDDRLKSSEQIERELRLPSLALVPDFFKLMSNGYGGRRLSSRDPKKLLEGAAADSAKSPPARTELKDVMVVAADGHSPAGELYHSICTALLFSQAGQTPKSVLITSAVEGEGKTVTALNVAIAFAQTSGSVLLVDGDLRKPRCHEILGIANHAGLSDVLTGQMQLEEVIHHPMAGLAFLSAGSDCPNPAALLGSGTMRELLARLCEQYDRVVVDAPPVMPVSDAATLSTMADGVLMIVGAPTSKRVVRQACAKLRYVGAKIFGVVLNRVDTASPDYYLYNPYTSYYSRKPSAPS
ncbi:MAG: polysaccharide biosynthesis tyrosine autokinase [Candidatus Binataceae bacterium]|nr:polysaccharide biosynthesis tyrosine autokinase [Candidatus Binataceae bacterium]